MKRLGKCSKCFLLLFALSFLLAAVLHLDTLAEDQSQDPEYYKYLKRMEAYQKQEKQFSTSTIATYAADASTTIATESKVVRKGIDISQFNGTIDWAQVKKAGIKFVIVRVAYRQWGDGIIVADPAAVQNLKDAKAAGLDVGAYIYSQAITKTEAIEEADKAITVVKKSGVTLDLPIVLDFEYANNAYGYLDGRLYNKHLTKTAATTVCKGFVTRVKECGYDAMIYASRSMLEDQLDAVQLEAVSQIWLAEWTTTPKYKGAYDMWQYTETGKVAGIDSYVDLNYQYIPRNERVITVGTTGTTTSTNTVPPNTDVFKNSMVTYTPVKAETGKVIASSVNVRKGPGTNYLKLGTIYKNHKFTVNGKYKDAYGMLWYRVKITLDNVVRTAYICSDYVCLLSEIPKAPVLKQTTQTMTSIKLRWSAVSGAEKYKIFRYNTAKGTYSLIATVSASATSYTDRGLVSYKKQKYYVRAVKYKYVNPITSVKSNIRIGYTGGIRGYVNRTSGLNVYSSSTSSTVRCKLNYNERVNIIKTVGNRYKVYYDHDTTTKLGYVSKRYITQR